MAAESSPVDEVAEAVSSLYAEPLDSFISSRRDLAKRLKAEGRRDDAAEVAKLRKPTVAAWAIGATARANPDRIEELIGLGGRLRAAQSALLAGAKRDELRAALDERRSIVRALADDAVARLAAAGGNGENARDEIVATFEAASLDAEVAGTLAAGRLTKTVSGPVGFDVLGGMAVAASTATDDETGDDTAGDDGAAADRVDERQARLDERAGEARADADAAWQALEAARADVEQREHDLTRLQRDLDAARRVVEAAERAADDAERAATKAERAAER